MHDELTFVFGSTPDAPLLVRRAPDGSYSIPSRIETGPLLKSGGSAAYPGTDGDSWGLMRDAAPMPDGMELMSRREIPAKLSMELFDRCTVAYQVMNIRLRNTYCGVCGTRMADHPRDRAMQCPKCGNAAYNAASPAVIVAVTKGDKLLMGHNAAFRGNMYSVLAGFVEPGESAEDTVRREIWEEARVRVKNIRYFMSQMWPFPNSLMLAFKADWESGEPEPGDGELTDVRWFSREEAPAGIPGSISVARKLIDDWLAGGR